MKAISARRAIADLRRLAEKQGIKLEIVDSGKGSHKALRFRDIETGESIQVVIPQHREISTGVQRELLKYVAGLATLTIAVTVRRILAEAFQTADVGSSILVANSAPTYKRRDNNFAKQELDDLIAQTSLFVRATDDALKITERATDTAAQSGDKIGQMLVRIRALRSVGNRDHEAT